MNAKVKSDIENEKRFVDGPSEEADILKGKIQSGCDLKKPRAEQSGEQTPSVGEEDLARVVGLEDAKQEDAVDGESEVYVQSRVDRVVSATAEVIREYERLEAERHDQHGSVETTRKWRAPVDEKLKNKLRVRGQIDNNDIQNINDSLFQ